MVWMHFFSRLAGIAGAGFLVWICLPSGTLAMVPFALVLQDTGPVAGLLWGLAGGALFWLVSTFWVFHSFEHLMGWSVALSILGTLVFALVQGLPYALFGFAQGFLQARGQKSGPVFSAALLTLFFLFSRPPVPVPQH